MSTPLPSNWKRLDSIKEGMTLDELAQQLAAMQMTGMINLDDTLLALIYPSEAPWNPAPN